MNKNLCAVTIEYFDYDKNPRFHDETMVYGVENAKYFANMLIKADNVCSVDVIDAMTGELYYSYRDGEIRWEV